MTVVAPVGFILAVEIVIIAMRISMVVIVVQRVQMEAHTVQEKNVMIVAFCVM